MLLYSNVWSPFTKTSPSISNTPVLTTASAANSIVVSSKITLEVFPSKLKLPAFCNCKMVCSKRNVAASLTSNAPSPFNVILFPLEFIKQSPEKDIGVLISRSPFKNNLKSDNNNTPSSNLYTETLLPPSPTTMYVPVLSHLTELTFEPKLIVESRDKVVPVISNE